MTLYKVLNVDGAPCHGGIGRWSLPAQNEDGSWTPGEWWDLGPGEMAACTDTALHLCQDVQVLTWLGPAIFEAEAVDAMDVGDKCITRKARLLRRFDTWNDRTARLFACDCAEHVQPKDADPRSLDAIATARRYARGEATRGELAAAWAAAWDAAWAAAGDAAGDAAWAAAWDAERAWQYGRLVEYLEGRA